MQRLCHRCSTPLAGHLGAQGPGSDDDLLLFCPRCGAPQILLPDYMRSESGADNPAGSPESTTGSLPPPRPQLVEWSVAVACAAPVAALTAVLALGALRVPGLSFLNTLCVLGGTGIVLGLYRARRPLARVNGRIGMRIGLLTGLLMIAAMGIALSGAGVVERFATHGMANFDAEATAQFSQFQSQMIDKMREQEQGTDAEQKVTAYLSSPEVRAGLALFYLATLSLVILTCTTACGAFAGMLQTRRRPLPRGE